jgi:hypothetical protein
MAGEILRTARMGYHGCGSPAQWSAAVRAIISISLSLVFLGGALFAAAANAVPVSRLEVRVVTGSQELSAGSDLELRIYEAGKSVRRLPLVHGEAWLPDSTHLIPLKLNDSLDPRNVLRFALYYRAANPLSRSWEVVAADVELPGSTDSPERLLGATLSGVIPRQGELASVERDQSTLACMDDSDCDDRRACNGRERCAPHSAGADARGCVKGAPVVCPVNQVCGESVGCHGTDALKTFNADSSAKP